MPPPKWIKPQLCKLAAKAPSGPLWVHEIKFDGYRIAARIDQGAVQLLTRSGLDWTAKYPATAAALTKLKVESAYLDGELCGVRPDGVSSFALMQQASGRGGAGLVYFVFDLLDLDGEDLAALPLLDRKAHLAALLEKPPDGIAFSAQDLRRRGVPPRRLPTWPRRRRLQARRSPLSPRRPQRLDQIRMSQSRRIRHRRLVGPGRVAALSGLLAARLSRRRRPVALRRPCRNRHVAEDARPPPPSPRATRRPENAARRSAAARNPLRRPARPLEGALGPPGAGRRDHLSDLGRGRLASPHRLRRPARGQACPRSPTRAPGLTPANGSRLAVLATCMPELSNGRLLLVETRAFSCGVPSSYPPPCFGTRS